MINNTPIVCRDAVRYTVHGVATKPIDTLLVAAGDQLFLPLWSAASGLLRYSRILSRARLRFARLLALRG